MSIFDSSNFKVLIIFGLIWQSLLFLIFCGYLELMVHLLFFQLSFVLGLTNSGIKC